MKQTVSHSKLRPWQGILIVLLLVALLVAINYLLGLYLQRLVGYTAASIAFWVIGAGIAYYTFRRFVVAYTYELTEDVLRLNRAYGKRERHICDIYVNRMLFVGTREEAQKRYGKTRIVRALRGCDDLPVTAIVYDASDGRHTALLQANDELRGALIQCIKRK